ncbi:MAG: hypothetical protein KBA75_02275 [Alphaproteobacteria bacterium]|nr:hypothetical protein [Alphaproteobacteria bacterium]
MVLLEHGALHSDKIGWAKAMVRVTRQAARLYGVIPALRLAKEELTKSRIAAQLKKLDRAQGRVTIADYEPKSARILVTATSWPNTGQRGVDGEKMIMGSAGREITAGVGRLHVYNEPSISSLEAVIGATDCITVHTIARDVDKRFRAAAAQNPLALTT